MNPKTERQTTDRASTVEKVMSMGSSSDILLDSHQVVLGSSFAAGGHARIYNGTFGSQKVALKEDMYQVPGELDEATAHETGILIKMRHPHIVRFFGLWRSPNSGRIFMVLEYCGKGDMGVYIEAHPEVDKPLKYNWAVQLADALYYLHACTPPIIHRDLKPSNVLIDDKINVKLTDFGIAKVDSSRDMTTQVGTVAFMPPEAMDGDDDEEEEENEVARKLSAIDDKKIDGKKWDVYSLAICYAHIFTGKDVYEGLSNPKIFRLIPKGTRPDLPDVDEPTQVLMKKMWTKKHRDRPSMLDVLTTVKKLRDQFRNSDSDSAEERSNDDYL